MDVTDVSDTRIRVILRVRPPNKQEKEWFSKGEYHPILKPVDQTPNSDRCILQEHNGKENRYDRIFRDDCKQQHIFRDAALPTLENVFKGYCGAIMAYGQTGTGKTHTMQGYDRTAEGDDRGIIPRAADYIFSRASKEIGYQFHITISMVQIYLDRLQDLFVPEAPELGIVPDTERVEMPGLTEKVVTSAHEFMKLFYFGEAHRMTRATLMNPTSSRGHAALICNLRMTPEDPSMSTKIGKLVLVDLAGYERFALTGITTGIAAEEAKKINASLLALGAVVNSLAEKQKHVPFRNSKLTRLLRDCLGGTSKSTIVLTIGPCDRYKQETAGTLYFGFRAMAVKVDARVKEEYDPLKYIAVLRERLAKCGRTMASMVRFLKEKHFWNEYKSLYGEPTIPDFEKGEEEPESPLSPTSPLSGDLARTLSASSLPTARDLMEEEAEDPHCQLPATVKAVQKEWRKEEVEHRKAAERELEVLRLRQIAEMKEAKKAGKSEAVLANLRKSHEDELEMMKEGNQLMRAEILRQQHKEQAQALLSSALSTMAADHGDMGRVGEMVAHLQETCESKDEILIRLFDLICLREAEVHDLEANLSAIANAIDPAFALQKQNVRLKEELSRKDHQLDNLKELLRQSGGVYNAASADCFGIDGESCSPRRASRPGSVPIGAGSPKMGALSPNAFPVHGAHGSPKRMSSEFGAASPSHTATLVSRDSAASPERVSLARVPSDPHHFDSGASSPKVVSRDHSHLSPEVGGSSPPKRVSPNRAEPDFPGRRGPGVHHAQGAGALGAHSPRALNGFPQHSA